MAKHSRKLVFPEPFCPIKPYRLPMVNSISHSSINTLPFIVMEKFVILISLAAICEERTPVTVRFKPALEMPLISALPIACSKLVISSSSSSPLIPFFDFFFFALSASLAAFFSALAASFLAFSSATCKINADASASSAARFFAMASPKAFGSNSSISLNSSGISV